MRTRFSNQILLFDLQWFGNYRIFGVSLYYTLATRILSDVSVSTVSNVSGPSLWGYLLGSYVLSFFVDGEELSITKYIKLNI